jgi:hypothetical protein
MSTAGERAAKARAVEAAWRAQMVQSRERRPVQDAYAGRYYPAEHRAARWVWLAVVAVLVLLAGGWARADTLGVNIVTAHDEGGYQRFTPGVYWRSDSGLGAGVLRNSLGRISWHADWTLQTAPLWAGVRLCVTAGYITGYPVPLQPFVMPSVLLAERHRIIYVPRKPDDPHSAQAVNYAVEFKF